MVATISPVRGRARDYWRREHTIETMVDPYNLGLDRDHVQTGERAARHAGVDRRSLVGGVKNLVVRVIPRAAIELVAQPTRPCREREHPYRGIVFGRRAGSRRNGHCL